MTKITVLAVCHWQEENYGSSCRGADLLTVSYDQVHRLALLTQACPTACSGLLLLRRMMTRPAAVARNLRVLLAHPSGTLTYDADMQ